MDFFFVIWDKLAFKCELNIYLFIILENKLIQ